MEISKFNSQKQKKARAITIRFHDSSTFHIPENDIKLKKIEQFIRVDPEV